MSDLYKAEWPAKWLEISMEAAEILRQKLAETRNPVADGGWPLANLGSACLDVGLSHLALGNASEASGWMANAVRCDCLLWEGFAKGAEVTGNLIGPETFSGILVAYACQSRDVIDRLRGCSKSSRRTPSPYTSVNAIGLSIEALMKGEIEIASKILSGDTGNSLPEHAFYLEIIRAITSKDQNAFAENLLKAEESWVKWVKKDCRGMKTGLPQLAAFERGVGFQRLAFDVCGWTPYIHTKYMPAALLSDQLNPSAVPPIL